MHGVPTRCPLERSAAQQAACAHAPLRHVHCRRCRSSPASAARCAAAADVLPALRGSRRAFDVAVLGSGAFARAAARELARTGRRVLLCDPAPAGAAADGPPLRLLRTTADEAALAEFASDAAPQWLALEADAGRAQLLLPCGALHLASAGSARLARLDGAADGLQLLGGAPLVRFGAGAALRTSWPALAGAPQSWEGRLDAAGGALFNDEACALLLARAERAGAACWDAAPLLACEDRGASFRLALSSPDAVAADVAAGDLRSCDWVEVEQILLAPERANEIAALVKRIGIPLAFPTARNAWAAVRSRATVDTLRLLPAWRLLEPLPDEAAADSAPSTAPPSPPVEGFPLCTDDGRVQISACHAGSAKPAPAATAEDAAIAAAAAQLIPALGQGATAGCSSRFVPVAPDGLPLFGYAPGFEEGRIVVAVGEMQHALGFARSARALLDGAMVTEVPLPLLSPSRKCVVEAAAAEAESAAAAATAAAASAEEQRYDLERDAARAREAASDAASLLQGRAPRNVKGEDDGGGFQPRAARRPAR